MAQTLTRRNVAPVSNPVSNSCMNGRNIADTRNKRNMQCQLRIVARVRPLSKQERDRKCLVSVRPVPKQDETTTTKNSAKLPMNQVQPMSKSSAQRRRRSSPPRLTPSSPNTVQRESLLSPNAKNLLERKKSQATSLIAGTENLSKFDFDAVLGPEASQKEVYIQSVRNAIRLNTPRGINTTIIAIGHDGSGKSYTMSGGWKTDMSTSTKIEDPSKFQVGDEDGILPRAVHDLFKTKQRLSSTGEVVVTMSFYEISQEGFRDLLENKPIPAVGTRDVSKIQVESSANVKALMDRVSKQRAKSTTTRRRCHRFCSFQTTYKVQSNASSSDSSSRENNGDIVSKLTFINLAGPGLPNWMDVVPFSNDSSSERSQKLNDILRLYTAIEEESGRVSPSDQDSVISMKIGDTLRGPCLAILVACVSPADSSMESTLDILRMTQIPTKTKEPTAPDEREVKTPSKEEFSIIYKENLALKEKIAELSRERSSESFTSNENLLDDSSLSSLQQKMRQVEEAAQKAKESSRSFAAAADRWRSHRKLTRNTKSGNDIAEGTTAGTPKGLVLTNKSIIPEEKCQKLDNSKNDLDKAQIKANEATIQTLQDHVNHLAGVCKAEAEKRELIAKEKEELSQKLSSMETQYLEQVERAAQVEEELRECKKLLSGERLLTDQLEKLRESSKRKALLLDRKIDLLTEKLEAAMAEKESIENQCDGHSFILDGERRLRQQAQELQQELERNYIELSSSFNSLKLKQESFMNAPARARDVPVLPISTESAEKSNENHGNGVASLLTVVNEVGESPGSVFVDGDDETSENKKSKSKAAAAEKQETASQLVAWAENEVKKSGDFTSMSSSSASLPSANMSMSEQERLCRIADEIVIGNMDDMSSLVSGSCQTTGFSVESTQHTEFFLPNLSPAGPYDYSLVVSDASICDLKNILRPWQVEFLASLGITTASEFVSAHTKDEHKLAKQMRRWRRKQRLPSIKTRSCAIALLIWARTCNAVDRFYLEQLKSGNANPRRPEFLEVCPSGSRSMSSLGFGSSIVDPRNQMEV